MNNNVIELTEANFEKEVLNARNPVLVQFWAGWSAPCRVMESVLESVSEDVPVRVARVNVEHHEELAEQYGVRAVPTLLIFNRDDLQDQIVGRASEQEVREKLEHVK
jgi:thioredoxin 1